MAEISDLPPELVLHTASLLTREIILDPKRRIGGSKILQLELVPDLPSINALSQTNRAFHRTLTQTLYDYCASVEDLGELALLFAVEHQLENTLDKLVAVGISLNCRFYFERDNTPEYGTLLHIAAAMGHGAMVAKLLELYGAEKTTRTHIRLGSDYSTALDYAARWQHMDTVRLLTPIPISNSLSFMREEYLSVALVESARAGDREISEYLISEGADVNFFIHEDAAGRTPLYWAAGSNNLALVQFLLACGADPNLQPRHAQNAYGYTTRGYITLFNAAAHNHNVEIIQTLVTAGADIHVKDTDSCTVLGFCADVKLLRFFLERGVDPNAEDKNKMTALHKACAQEDAELAKAFVELLLQFGAGPVDRTSLGRLTTVDIELNSGLSEVMKILEFVDIPSDTVEGTAVDFAMHNGYLEVVKILEPLVEDPKLLERIAGWWEKRKREEERGDA